VAHYVYYWLAQFECYYLAHFRCYSPPIVDTSSEFKKLSKAASFSSTDTCFVMMPFAPPLGDYFSKIFEPAIEKAGLKAVRA